MSLTVKAFLYKEWGRDPIEIRRFTIDQDVTTSYAYLTQKIAQVFPDVRSDGVIVAWTDSEGDRIVISSDEELLEALDQFDGTLFRIHLKKREGASNGGVCFAGPPREPPVTMESDSESDDEHRGRPEEGEGEGGETSGQQPPRQGGTFHPGVICDGCNGSIQGNRFKCLVCNDYDLCSSCEQKGLHVEHNMVNIADPSSYSPWGFPHTGSGWGQHGCPMRWRHGRGSHFRGPRHPFHSHHHRHGHGPHSHGPHAHGPHGHSPHAHGPQMWAPWAAMAQAASGGGNPFAGFGFCGGPRSGPCGPQGGRRCAGREGCCPGKQQPAEQSGPAKEPMDTDPQPKGEQDEEARLEQQRRFLLNVGEVVSGFLQPLGIKVDVDVMDEGADKEGEPKSKPGPGEGDLASGASDVPSGSSANTAFPGPQATLDPASPPDSSFPATAEFVVPPSLVEEALRQLRSMGFDDEGGWLTELVKAKGGDIGKVLDALHPGQSN